MRHKLLCIVVEYTLMSFLGQLLRHWTESQLRTRHLVCNLRDELIAKKVHIWRCWDPASSHWPFALAFVIATWWPYRLATVRIGTQVEIHLLLPREAAMDHRVKGKLEVNFVKLSKWMRSVLHTLGFVRLITRAAIQDLIDCLLNFLSIQEVHGGVLDFSRVRLGQVWRELEGIIISIRNCRRHLWHVIFSCWGHIGHLVFVIF